MGIDFSKRSRKKTVEKKIHPCEIYDTLDRHANKGPLRKPVQESVLSSWFDNFQMKKDVILKLPTGEGKTLIGLMILQSKINQDKGSCLYVCPDKYLAEQVKEQANEFGISVCSIEGDTLPDDFMNGERILVTHAHVIFNGKSKRFGIGTNSISVENILLDDAHSCIDVIKDACKIRISRKFECYNLLLDLFKDSLQSQGSGTFEDIKNKRKSAILAVPYWDWNVKKDEVISIIGKYNVYNEKGIWFAWDLLKDNLLNCIAVFSGNEIEITPYTLPIEQFGAFFNSNHRIFMSATISDDSFFIKDLGLTKDVIETPLTYEKKWSGEKMVLIPSLIDQSLSRENIINWLGKWQKLSYGVLAITPSTWHTKIWEKNGCIFVDKNNQEDEVKNLKSGVFSNPLVMASKYDGIDLPDNMCRILILDSLPSTETITEKYIENCIPNSTFTKIKTAQTIEQGLGRAVRGEKDYCVALLIGSDLVKQIRYKSSREYLSPQTRKQIEIGLELATFSKEDKKDTQTYQELLVSVMIQSIKRDGKWKDWYAEQMDEIELRNPGRLKIDEIIILEKEAETLFNNRKYVDASKKLQTLLDDFSDSLSDKEKGWYLQNMARYLYFSNPGEGMKMQVNAHQINKSLFLPPQGYEVSKIDLKSQERVNNIKNRISDFENFDELIVYTDDIFSSLHFGINAPKFESAMDELGQILGYNTERPDDSWKAGPDNLWAIKEGEYLFIECKSEVKLTRAEINKDETGQFNNNIAWFGRWYPGVKVHFSMIIPSKKVNSNTGFNKSVKILRERGLKNIRENTRKFILGFKDIDLKDIADDYISSTLGHNKLTTDEILSNFENSIPSN